MAGMPSSTLPSTTNATIETAMKVTAPPGSPAIAAASEREKPDCVSAQAMPVAAPMMSRIAPDRARGLHQHRQSRRQSNRR